MDKSAIDKESFTFKAAQSFAKFASPHNLMIIYGKDEMVRRQSLNIIYDELSIQNEDKDITLTGAGMLAEIESLIEEKIDILIINEIQDSVVDSAKLLELLGIYINSRDKKLLLISDRHPLKLTNIDEKCKSVLQTFLIADLQP